MADAGVQASIHKNRNTTRPRVNNFISSTRFQDVNLLGKLYPSKQIIESLSHWALPGGEGAWQEWSFNQITQEEFTPAKVGDSFGPTWSTHWFKLEFSVPKDWAGKEVRVRWDTQAEGTFWSSEGEVLQGLTNDQRRTEYILSHNYDGDETAKVFYVEMACTGIGSAADGDGINPPNLNKYYTLNACEIVVLDVEIYKLSRDMEVMYQLSEHLGDDARGYQALYTGNQMVNSIIAGDQSGASSLADAHLSKGNGARAHTLAAMGNCHIDTAWLWPYSETKRKVARSFSSQLKLMEDYPEYIFVASQAQQWAWCKQYYPELFERIRAQVSAGKFVPVGGVWVEMDGNVPSGESFVRQFLHGQGFFKKEFGITCKEYWLPDTFGYSAQIPGLMRHMGMGRFLTQKMSWSIINKFPHHNFVWEGIDGSSVLAHFPPGDSYVMNNNVDEALRTVNNLQDKGRVGNSAFLFGYGDGGGGPTQDMLERSQRLKDVDGVPKMVMTTPDDLFSALEKEEHNLCRWVGELYLELHNGTYTSQAAMKRLCRAAEFSLRDAEFLLSSACLSLGSAASGLLIESLAKLDPAWKNVLLNQFHDVLPGSGIGIIYPQAQKLYEDAIASANEVWDSSAIALFGSDSSTKLVAMNTLQWERQEVVSVPLKTKEKVGKAEEYKLLKTTPFGYSDAAGVIPDSEVTVSESDGIFTLSNGLLRAQVNSHGQVISLVVAGDDRDVFKKDDGTQLLGNQLMLYDDQPLYWDAWDVMDYHLETGRVMNAEESGYTVTPVTIVESDPLVAKLRFSVAISSSSSINQEIELAAATPYLTFSSSVSWHENRKFLKTMFDTNVMTRNATYDIQFGHLQRPTHMNTSWDWARYEVCGHKWADLSEPDWGVAVLNNSKYGWMGRGNSLTLSLLKSPKAPDDNCDIGDHTFKYALMPHTGTLQQAGVMHRAYEFNNPLRLLSIPASAATSWSVVKVEGAGVVLHTLKPAEDGSGDVVFRLFESNGSKSKATVSFPEVTSFGDVFQCNGLEDPITKMAAKKEGKITEFSVSLSPFQIVAFRAVLSPPNISTQI